VRWHGKKLHEYNAKGIQSIRVTRQKENISTGASSNRGMK